MLGLFKNDHMWNLSSKKPKRKNMRREVWRQSSTFDNAINHEEIIVNYESLIYWTAEVFACIQLRHTTISIDSNMNISIADQWNVKMFKNCAMFRTVFWNQLIYDFCPRPIKLMSKQVPIIYQIISTYLINLMKRWN